MPTIKRHQECNTTLDVVESLKEIAPQRRFSGYRLLLKAYVSGELRQDEARYTSSGPPLD